MGTDAVGSFTSAERRPLRVRRCVAPRIVSTVGAARGVLPLGFRRKCHPDGLTEALGVVPADVHGWKVVRPFVLRVEAAVLGVGYLTLANPEPAELDRVQRLSSSDASRS
jgi:hypothetical protein